MAIATRIESVEDEFSNLDQYVRNAGWITTADGNRLWATITSVDAMGNRLTTHEASFHVTAAAIEGIVSRIDAVEDEFTHLDSYVRSAGWITTADGNRLWATITQVDLLGNRLTTHESGFHVTAAAISAMVSRLDTIDNTILTAGWVTTADGNLLWASKTLENGNSIISYINQTATTITISAQRIKLEGLITANNNVQFTTDGRIVARNVDISGKITATSGTFTGTINATSGTLKNVTIQTSETGNRILIDASTRSIRMITSAGLLAGEMSFADGSVNSSTYTSGNISIYARNSSRILQESILGPDGLRTNSYKYANVSTPTHMTWARNFGLVVNVPQGSFEVGDGEIIAGPNIMLFRIRGLPTSSSGLTSGYVWRDGTTLRIVP